MQLNDFLREWLTWAEGPEPEKSDLFSTADGLCDNTHYWTPGCEPYLTLRNKLRLTLKKDFTVNHTYPFNNGDEDEYMAECKRAACHLNLSRLAWVRKEIENG